MASRDYENMIVSATRCLLPKGWKVEGKRAIGQMTVVVMTVTPKEGDSFTMGIDQRELSINSSPSHLADLIQQRLLAAHDQHLKDQLGALPS